MKLQIFIKNSLKEERTFDVAKLLLGLSFQIEMEFCLKKVSLEASFLFQVKILTNYPVIYDHSVKLTIPAF